MLKGAAQAAGKATTAVNSDSGSGGTHCWKGCPRTSTSNSMPCSTGDRRFMETHSRSDTRASARCRFCCSRRRHTTRLPSGESRFCQLLLAVKAAAPSLLSDAAPRSTLLPPLCASTVIRCLGCWRARRGCGSDTAATSDCCRRRWRAAVAEAEAPRLAIAPLRCGDWRNRPKSPAPGRPRQQSMKHSAGFRQDSSAGQSRAGNHSLIAS